MKYFLLLLASLMLFNCSDDSDETTSSEIDYAGSTIFASEDASGAYLNTVYIEKKTSDNVYDAKIYSFSDKFSTVKSLVASAGYFFMLSDANSASSGKIDDGIITLNPSTQLSADSVFDIAIDRHKRGYTATKNGLIQYNLETFLPTDTINAIFTKLGQRGDTIFGVNTDGISIIEDDILSTVKTTKIVEEIVGIDSNVFILANDSNVYKINLKNGAESAVTTSSDIVAITISSGELIIASSKEVSALFTNSVYQTTNTVFDINGTLGATIAFEKDSSNTPILKVIDTKYMEEVFYSPVIHPTVIPQK